MWIRNKRTGEYKCESPAVAKYHIHHDTTKSWEDTQSQYCSCGAVNHREATHCKHCSKELRVSKSIS
jgi:hypothetical protein